MEEKLIAEFIEQMQILLLNFNLFSRQTADEFQKKYGWNDNDARMVFYNAAGQKCFLHGVTIYFINNEICKNKNQWYEKQDYFPITDVNRNLLVDNYSQQIRDNFFWDILILIEHAIRIFAERMVPAIINDNISNVKDLLINQLNLDSEYKNLLNILFKTRNSIHNGGLFSKDQPCITYKGRTFEFFKKKETQTDLNNIEFLFQEAFMFMKELFDHDESKKINNIEHPYAPLFAQ